MMDDFDATFSAAPVAPWSGPYPQVFFLKGSVEGVGFRGLGKSGLCKTFVEAYRVQGIRG